MMELDLIIQNATGLHARPAKTFVKLAKGFESRVTVQHAGKQVNGKSLIGVLKLGVKHAGAIQIVIDGADEAAAAQALERAVMLGLGEETHSPVLSVKNDSSPASQNGGVVAQREKKSENRLTGVPASAGIAIGTAWRYVSAEKPTLPDTFSGAAAENTLLQNALEAAKQHTVDLCEQTRQQVGAEEAAIFEAQLELLNDPDLLQTTCEKIEQGQNAARAWTQVIEQNATLLAGLDDAVLAARSADIRDIGGRVLVEMTGQTGPELPTVPFVLLADDLSPSMTATLDKNLVQAICTATGGPNAHAAILARAFGLPAIVGIGEHLLDLEDGILLIVDGAAGTIQLAPSVQEVHAAEAQRDSLRGVYAKAVRDSAEFATTTDNHRVEIVANIGNLAEAQEAQRLGAEGVGLLRTEFLFLNRENAPTVSQQAAVYGDILAALKGQPVIIRTLDVGGDKPLSYINVPPEDNPFLGERGIRLCLNRPKLFQDQLTAIAQASVRGLARVMFPMVSDIGELHLARTLLQAACAAEGVAPPEIGIMIEVPAAALLADIFAPHVDFFSIGTNDLTQYTVAVDRMHPSLTHLSDGLNPAVLRLIAKTVEAAHAAGKWVGVCGELGADPQAIPILVGLGVDELSVNVPALPTVKAQIRTLSLSAAQELAQQALGCASAVDVRNLKK